MAGLNYGSTKTLKAMVRQKIKDALRMKDGAKIKFTLDLLKIEHSSYFNECVADVLNEFGRKNMLNLDGASGPTLREQESSSERV